MNKNLIKILNDGKYHSGNALGEKLNITRSAVWKFINQLKEYGLAIDVNKTKGYCLQQPLILLNARNIATPCPIKIFDSITSTNDYLKTVKKSPFICLAEQQTAGRGRLGRNWYSPFGLNIYLSCLWDFNKDISELSGLTLIVSLAVIKALNFYTKDLKIKWPNDILYKDKKLAGILVEINAETHGNSQAIIGIGLNVNMRCTGTALRAPTSLIDILKNPQDRNKLTEQLINQLFYYLNKFDKHGIKPFLSEWKKYDYLKNKKIKLIHGQKSIGGEVYGINEQGYLLLKHRNGKVVAYSSGDTSSQPTR
jgi:BirA family biotin operon repressor/biotin-[acetyl-CoA-carboxylase] ligase